MPFLRHATGGKKLTATFEKQHGKGKALSILAHKILKPGMTRCQSGLACPRAAAGRRTPSESSNAAALKTARIRTS